MASPHRPATTNPGRRAAFRRVWRPALLVLAALFLATCGPPPDLQRPDLPLPEDADISERPAGRYGGVFVESNAQEPKTFNPLVSEDAYSAEAIGLMQSSLTDYDPVKQEVVPALARDWEIGPDNKVYTFHLRRGVRWSTWSRHGGWRWRRLIDFDADWRLHSRAPWWAKRRGLTENYFRWV